MGVLHRNNIFFSTVIKKIQRKMKFLSLALLGLSNLSAMTEAAKPKPNNPWIWCYQLSKDAQDFKCYSENKLDNYFHAHLLPHINENYRQIFNNEEHDNKVTFDNLGCLNAFGKTVTNSNKKQWRWEPCHIDSVKYKRYNRQGTTKFAVGIYLQQYHGHSSSSKCDEHIRCDAVMYVRDKKPDQPKFGSVNCYKHKRIMNYEDAKQWRKEAK